MIRYTLTCANDHSFESWFQSAAAFDSLAQVGMVTCPECGGSDVAKRLMAPAVQKSAMPVRPLSDAPKEPLEKLRAEVEANADYVGSNFATEARAMHDGDRPERAIYGESTAKDTKKLIEDGIPVLPLPFVPTKRSN